MTDFTQAAQNEATALLSDGSTVTLYFNPGGVDGWLDAVIYAYDDYDDMLIWDTNGIAIGHTENILEIL